MQIMHSATFPAPFFSTPFPARNCGGNLDLNSRFIHQVFRQENLGIIVKITGKDILVGIRYNNNGISFPGYGISQISAFKYRQPGVKPVSDFP